MDIEQERQLLAKYPYHIVALVRAAKDAVREGRARIDQGVFVVESQSENEPGTCSGNGSDSA